MDADIPPSGSEDATPGSGACVRVSVLLGRVGRACLPGTFWCASPFSWPLCHSVLLSPLRAGVAPSCRSVCLLSVLYFVFGFSFLPPRPRCFLLCLVSGPGCPGPWRCVPRSPPTPLFFPSLFFPSWFSSFSPSPSLPSFFLFSVSALVSACLVCCLLPPAVLSPPPPALLFCPPPVCALLSCVLRCPVTVFCAVCCAVVSRLAWLWAVVRFFVFCCVVPCCWLLLCVLSRLWSCLLAALFALWLAVLSWCALLCAVVRPSVLCCAVLLRVAPPGIVLLCAVFFLSLFLVLLRAVSCPGALSALLGSCAYRRCVLSYLPALSVFCRGVLVRPVVRRCALCRVRPGLSCCAFPVISAPSGAALRRGVRLVCAVSGAWCCSELLSVVQFPAVLCCVAARCAVLSCGAL